MPVPCLPFRLPRRSLRFLLPAFLLLLASPVSVQADRSEPKNDPILLAKLSSRQQTAPRDQAPLWNYVDPTLQRQLSQAVERLGLDKPCDHNKLAMALVDITDPKRPRVAAVNGDEMLYAASLPKIAVLLAVFEKAAAGRLAIDSHVEQRMLRMIRNSDDEDSSYLMNLVGKEYIAQVLTDPRYRLYDPQRNGGLWAGKDYGKAGLWQRDPLHNLSHGATAMQVARFYYLLENGRLVSPEASRQMKEILANTAINHKFKKGLAAVRPDAAIYRKSGTWQSWHSDSAIVERPGARYIAVALSESPAGAEWMEKIIVAMDSLAGTSPSPIVSLPPKKTASASRQAKRAASKPFPQQKQKKG